MVYLIMISDGPSQSLGHSGFGRRNEHEYGYGHNQTGRISKWTIQKLMLANKKAVNITKIKAW